MTIKLKSTREPTELTDGLRIFIARFRKPFLKKEDENWDRWYKELAPSRELLHDFIKSKKIGWTEYRKRFMAEIKNNPQAMEVIRWLSGFEINGNTETATLICFCEKENYCHKPGKALSTG